MEQHLNVHVRACMHASMRVWGFQAEAIAHSTLDALSTVIWTFTRRLEHITVTIPGQHPVPCKSQQPACMNTRTRIAGATIIWDDPDS